MEAIEPRVLSLEDINDIERCKLKLSKAIDASVNEGLPVSDIREFISDDYKWRCSQFVNADGVQAYENFLQEYKKRITFASTFIAGGIIDINSQRTAAQAQWSVWQAFSLGKTAWVLSGRSYDTFVRQDEAWRVQETRWDVGILSPWTNDWGRTRIAANWSWCEQ